jgi:benzoyl-CoA reductase/2-hydroxyglutaryl-CoA dehydratase subunit BcrC/BadD/HgdB
MSLQTLEKQKEISLPALKRIRDAVDARPRELEQARAEGRKVVGWIGYNVPEEILHALGLIPVRLGTGGDGSLVDVGARYISSKNCVFARAVVGSFEKREDPYVINSDLVAVDSTCLQLYRVAEIIEYYFKVKTHILGVPRNFYLPEARDYFFGEVEAFTQGLEEAAGQKLDLDRLAQSIKLYNAIREAVQALYLEQTRSDAAITWRETYDAVQAGYYLDRAQFLDLLNQLLSDAVAERGKRKLAAGPRILLSGSVIQPKDNKLIDILESLGARIVGDDLWSGNSPYVGLEVKEASLRGIADAYLDRLPHASLPYLDQATDRRLKHLRQLAQSTEAKGVVYHTLRYCDAWSFKAKETKEVLARDGVSLLEIHTEYSGSDFEAIRTRAEAFLEML